MRRFLFWVSGNLRVRLINDGERPYLERYYVGTLGNKRCYLHRFVDDDPDRGLHDHPWENAWSFILSGWYQEWRRSGLRSVRWFNHLEGDSFHQVVVPYGVSECWSLFIHTIPDAKKWGFMHLSDDGSRAEWSEYQYLREGPQKNWWTTALFGKHSARQPRRN